jgi:hypothetical protein
MPTETDDNSKSLRFAGLDRQHVFLDDFEIYKLPNSGRRHEKQFNLKVMFTRSTRPQSKMLNLFLHLWTLKKVQEILL